MILHNAGNYLSANILDVIPTQVNMDNVRSNGEDACNLLRCRGPKLVLVEHKAPVDAEFLTVVTETLGGPLAMLIREFIHKTL